jgi:DnaK suppressor protein
VAAWKFGRQAVRGCNPVPSSNQIHHLNPFFIENEPDPNDRASMEEEFSFELGIRDRERKLLRKIDEALTRIDNKTYGWCQETGEPIGLLRLLARPTATLCLEAQERHELNERIRSM